MSWLVIDWTEQIIGQTSVKGLPVEAQADGSESVC